MKVTFVTGNPGKAKYFSQLVGLEIPNHSADVDEIQSFDLKEIAIYKAKQAYEQIKTPVVVEDTALTINALGKLPGPFIKWFEIAMGLDGICALAGRYDERSAYATNVHVYFDGKVTKVFEGRLNGRISSSPKGSVGFGFNPIFIPESQTKTLAEMSEAEFQEQYLKLKPIKQVGDYLQTLALDKNKA